MIFLSHVLFSDNFLGCFQISLACLDPPGNFGVRALDDAHVTELETSFLDIPTHDATKFTALIIAPDIAQVSKESINSYRFLVLSGNHRRQALQNLTSRKACEIDTVWVDVYSGKI